MRLHCLRHIPFIDDTITTAAWAAQHGHSMTQTSLFAGEHLPAMSEFDFLVIMGGLMNIYDERQYPWLVSEKEFIAKSIEAGKRVLGLCLGGQLIADILGGKVAKNPFKEIGWFPVRRTPATGMSALLGSFPIEFTAFHWHSDMFTIPPQAVHLAASQGCRNQAFQYGDRVVGTQFHLEYSFENIVKMIKNCNEELVDALYIQSKYHLLDHDWTSITRLLFYRLLNSFVKVDAMIENGACLSK